MYVNPNTIRVSTAQGKQGKWFLKNPCQGKHREFGNFAKTQGIWFALVVNSLILKVKDILIFAAKIYQDFYPYENGGGGGKSFSHAEGGGHKKFWVFYAVA